LTSGNHAGQFELSLTDNTTKQSFVTYQSSDATQSPTASRSSAEWVVEAPTIGNSLGALANFGSVTFTNATATINGVTGPINDPAWQNQPINMGSRGSTIDTTSVLNSTGTGFTLSYNSSNSNNGFGGSSNANSLIRNAAADFAAGSASPVPAGPAFAARQFASRASALQAQALRRSPWFNAGPSSAWS
jgi:hypothetical protein